MVIYIQYLVFYCNNDRTLSVSRYEILDLITYAFKALFIHETPIKWVLWQTLKTHMKCSIMLHFIRVCTVCLGLNNLLGEK